MEGGRSGGVKYSESERSPVRGTTAATMGLLVLLALGMVTAAQAHPQAVVRPKAARSMTFGVMDPRVSYGIPSYNTAQVQEADLNMLFSTDASCVKTDIGYAPWLSSPVDSGTISLVSGVVAQIRAEGRCLVLADASSESYRSAPIPWAEFKTAWVQRVTTLAQLYHPDYYIVVKELSWYGPMISDASTNPLATSPSQWIGLTQALITAVQAVSPATRIGVSVGANSLTNPQFEGLYTSYLEGVSRLPGLSFIGFDIYGASDQSATQSYLEAHGIGGKQVWISETWSSPEPGTSADAQSDATWINEIYAFATQIHASFLIPFYTDLFSSYTWDANPTDIVDNYGLRQPVFYAFQSLAEQHGTPAPALAEALPPATTEARDALTLGRHLGQ
jgi:hypothetical protein